jgi:hypothetical protein
MSEHHHFFLVHRYPRDGTAMPPLWQLLAVVPGTALAIALLTAIPARISARRPVAGTLRSKLV